MVGLFRGMVFCLVLAAAGVAFAAQTQPSSTPQQKVAKQETRLGAEKSNENKDDENIAIQRKLAKFTFWLVVVGFIQAAILAATVCVIWKQISIARNIERAWVMADIEHDSQKWTDRKVHMLQGSGTGGDTTGFYAVLICRNEGRSPAWLGERRAKCEIVSSLPPKPNPELMEIIEVSPTPLGIGQATPHTERLSFPAIAKGHEEVGKMTVIYGIVKYRDIFGGQRQTTFGYRITADRKFVRLENYAEYNKNT